MLGPFFGREVTIGASDIAFDQSILDDSIAYQPLSPAACSACHIRSGVSGVSM